MAKKGRPKGWRKPGGAWICISLNLHPDDKAKLQETAKQVNKSTSEYIRRCLHQQDNSIRVNPLAVYTSYDELLAKHERERATRKAYYAKNKAKLNAQSKAHHEANKEEINAQRRVKNRRLEAKKLAEEEE